MKEGTAKVDDLVWFQLLLLLLLLTSSVGVLNPLPGSTSQIDSTTEGSIPRTDQTADQTAAAIKADAAAAAQKAAEAAAAKSATRTSASTRTSAINT